MESLRRPVLAQTLAALMDKTTLFTTGHHASLNLDIPPSVVPLLMTLYGGALFTLVSAPADTVTDGIARGLATAIVRGALPGSVYPTV
jgi:hypothetical protein